MNGRRSTLWYLGGENGMLLSLQRDPYTQTRFSFRASETLRRAIAPLTASGLLRSALRECPLSSFTREMMVLSRYPSFLRCHAYWSIFSRSGTTTDGVTRLVRGVGFEPTKAYATG